MSNTGGQAVAQFQARTRAGCDRDAALSALEAIVTVAFSVAENSFGPRVHLVVVREPVPALKVDYVEQIRLLEEWGVQNRLAGS